MSENINKYSDYLVMAVLHQSEKINVKLAFKGQNTLDNIYILNEFPFNSNDLHTFKLLFNMFHSKNKPESFVDFFVAKHHFYAIFKYTQCGNIEEKFQKQRLVMTFEERCKILENILIKLELLRCFPEEITGCISETQNINITDQNEIHFVYNLAHSAKYRGATGAVVYENIHNIISTLLAPEVKMKFNTQLHIVLDKCKQGVYSSIPQLVIDLKKAEKISKSSSWKSYIMNMIEARKPQINKIKRYTMIFLIICGAFYIGYSKISEGTNVKSTENVTIGGTRYNGNTQDESDKTLTSENQDNQTNEQSATSQNITLTKGLDIDYEDHIVKYGETVSSVAEDYYRDKKYITAVASFNGIEVTEKLTPGSILKMPNKTAIALYTSR